MKNKTYAVAVAAIFVLASAQASTTITFNNLGGANESTYSGSTESGFTITTTMGNWEQGQIFGNPTPSIFAGPIGSPVNSAIQLVYSGGSFNFDSLQYAFNNGSGTLDIFGYSGATQLFDQTASVGASGSVFSTLSGAFTGVLVDRLVIEVEPTGGPSSINLDNIVLDTPTTSSVPDSGATILLLGSGLAALAFVRRTLVPANR